MKFEQFKELVTLMIQEQVKQDEYLDKIPDDLKDSVFDNQYTNSLGRCNDKLAEVAFGDLWEDVAYFLYERPILSNIGKVVVNDVTYEFSTIDEFCDYMKTVHKFD